MNRRGFLQSILAAGMAPAIARAGVLMPVRSRIPLSVGVDLARWEVAVHIDQLRSVYSRLSAPEKQAQIDQWCARLNEVAAGAYAASIDTADPFFVAGGDYRVSIARGPVGNDHLLGGFKLSDDVVGFPGELEKKFRSRC